MSFRVRVKERGLPNGHVSIQAAAAVIATLRMALRAEAAMISSRKTGRGRISKLERESVAMSLVRIEAGSGTLVWDSEAASLIDIPREAFSSLIAEANPAGAKYAPNYSMKRALLNLQTLFHRDSDVEAIEFIDRDGSIACVDENTVERIRLSLAEQDANTPTRADFEISGRLLELDLAARSFRIHGIGDQQYTIHYDDLLEPLVRAAMKKFVAASVSLDEDGNTTLLSLDALDEVPESRFEERRKLPQIIAEQGVHPLTNFESLQLDDPDLVNEGEFKEFIRSVRGEKL